MMKVLGIYGIPREAMGEIGEDAEALCRAREFGACAVRALPAERTL